MIHGLYYVLGGAIRVLCKQWPHLETNKITNEHIQNQLKLSEIAFPLYCLVPTLGDFLRRLGISRVCDSFAECGGVLQSTFNFFCLPVYGGRRSIFCSLLDAA